MLTLTSLFELEVDDIISGMPGGAFAANVFAVRETQSTRRLFLLEGINVRQPRGLFIAFNLYRAWRDNWP